MTVVIRQYKDIFISCLKIETASKVKMSNYIAVNYIVIQQMCNYIAEYFYLTLKRKKKKLLFKVKKIYIYIFNYKIYLIKYFLFLCDSYLIFF